MRPLRRFVATALIASTALLVSVAGESSVSAAPTTSGPKDTQVQATVRVARIGANYDMDVQIIQVISGAPASLVPGETYKIEYPKKRRSMAKSHPELFAALKSSKVNAVTTVTITDTTGSSRRCWNTGTSTTCGASDETHEYELVSISAPTGDCLQGKTKRVKFDWNSRTVKPLACLYSAGGSSRFSALVDVYPSRTVKEITVNLGVGESVLTASSGNGVVAAVEVPGGVKAGRYKIGGCVDVLDDGEGCRDFPSRIVTYKPR